MKLFLLLTLFISGLTNGMVNPFVGKTFYVNPSFQANIDATIKTTTDALTLKNLKIVRDIPSAYWLDVMSKVQPGKELEQILIDASSKSPSQLCVFIVYDLPNRDCSAHSSNGELCCVKKSDGTCDYLATECNQGLNTYKTSYIDQIALLFKKYSTVPIVAVIEPDSLGNLVTNLGNPRCGAQGTQQGYKMGITYAVNQLSPLATIYLDSAWSGWLGWSSNAQVFQQLINSMGILPKIRGFATNVANYQPLGIACSEANFCLPPANHASHECCNDPCNLTSQWNPANNELNYVLGLATLFPDKHFIIDTGRNGVTNMRKSCSNWCNIDGAGLGMIPTTNTRIPNLVDAYYYLKTPGESDGSSNSSQSRFDHMCISTDSMKDAPTAGAWFDAQMKMLARNANFGNVAVNPTPQPPTPIPDTSTPDKPTSDTIPTTSDCNTQIWGQCNGLEFKGEKCCFTGLTCKFINDYYSQCQISSTPVPNPPTPAPSPPSPNPPTPTPSTGYWKCFSCENI